MIRLTEAQLHKLIKESVSKVLRESIDDDAFYRVQLCSKNGGETAMPEDFPSYEEALDYARNLHPSMGERVEIYKMCERGGKVDFIDQVH